MIKDKYVFTAKEIAKELQVSEAKILYWYEKFTDYFEADPIKIEKEFSQKDLMLFKLIRRLNVDDGLSMDEIRQYITECISEIHDNMILEPNQEIKSPTVINTEIKNIIAEEMKKHIDIAMKDLARGMAQYVDEKINQNFQQVMKRTEDLMEQSMETQQVMIHDLKVDVTEIQKQTKKEITNMVSNELKTAQNQFKSEIGNLTQEVKENEQKSMRRDIEMTNLLKENMALRKKEHQEQENRKKKKGFLSKIFG